MLDLGSSPRLVDEAVPVHQVVAEVELQRLERNRRAVARARGPEDAPHPALAEELLEPVVAERVAGLKLALRATTRHPHAESIWPPG